MLEKITPFSINKDSSLATEAVGLEQMLLMTAEFCLDRSI